MQVTRSRPSRTPPPADEAILQVWNDAGIALDNAAAACSLLSVVHPDPAVIGLAEQIELEVQAFRTDLFLDADVFALLGSVDGQPLDVGAQRMLDEALRDFRRAGVDRDEETRERVRTLDQRLTDLGQAFDRNIRDGRRTTLVPAAALDGLPEDFVAGHAPNEDGLVAITTEYPDLLPFLTFARDAVARRQVAHSFFNLAWPENDAVLEELLATRHEKATLLGYASWPDYDAETKMIGTGDAIGAFVDRDQRRGGRCRPSRDRRPCSSAPPPRARTRSTSPTGATTTRRSSASSTASTRRRFAATSTSARCTTACSTSPACCSA